jgi:hypothetical protein
MGIVNFLVDTEGRIGPEASKTHISFTFTLGDGTDALELSFGYEPKVLDDDERAKLLIEEGLAAYGEPGAIVGSEDWKDHAPVSNLLTLSLDDPEGFRGSGHRGAHRQTIRLSETAATPGFLAGPLPAGLWKATISVHLVASGSCTYRLKVGALRDGGPA